MAQWTVTIHTPTSTLRAQANSAAGSGLAGYAEIGGNSHASLWLGGSGTWLDLHPAGWIVSQVLGASPYAQVGYTYAGSPRAAFWSGSAGTHVNLHPPGALSSAAYATNGVMHVGRMQIGIVDHACVWTGGSNLATDIHPAGAASSYAFAISGATIVGRMNLANPSTSHAVIWHSMTSFVDLNPAGATGSDAFGIEGGQQVGYATLAGVAGAALWRNTAGSYVNLHQPSQIQSRALAVHAGWQVGYASSYISGVATRHAGVWNGTAASWVDLAAFLPPGYSSSEAHGVWHDGTTLYVCGWASDSQYYHQDAILWTLPIGQGQVATNEVFGQSCGPQSLVPMSRPVLGTAWDLTLTGLPTPTVFGVHWFGTSDPGILDLAAFGMPNCQLRGSLDVVIGPWLPLNGSTSYSVPIPTTPAALVGMALYTQGATFEVPPPNAFGAVTSHAVRGVLGPL